jgi:hypothetical protein
LIGKTVFIDVTKIPGSEVQKNLHQNNLEHKAESSKIVESIYKF